VFFVVPLGFLNLAVLIFLPYLNLAANAIKANPNSSEAHFCLAHTAQKEENFEMAITHFESALTLNSQDCGAFNNLGNCYDRLEKTTEAIEAYSKAIELDKDYIAAVYNRGNAFLKLGKEDLAYKDLSTAIELDANFYQAYYNRGTLLKRLGKSDQAQQDLDKVSGFFQSIVTIT
jgi:tetratricopeptide (TPR) repeat protein